MDGGQRTAYEVSEMMAEKAAVLGAELGSFNTALDGLLDSVYDIETNQSVSRMPKVPDILIEMGQQDRSLRFDPVYMGPLAQAQRERFSKDGIRKFMAEIAPLIDINPEVLDNFDLDEAGRVLADSNRVPAAIVRPKEAVEKIRQGRMQAQQLESQQQDAMSALQGLKTASEADRNMGGKLSQGLDAALSGGMPDAAAA